MLEHREVKQSYNCNRHYTQRKGKFVTAIMEVQSETKNILRHYFCIKFNNFSTFFIFLSFCLYFKGEQSLYDGKVLEKLDFRRSIAKFKPAITAINTGESWIKVRPLQDGDYDRGFLKLLAQLTGVGQVSRSDFLSMF